MEWRGPSTGAQGSFSAPHLYLGTQVLPSGGTFGASGFVCPMAQTLMPLGPEFALLAPRNVHWIPAPSLYSWMWERFFGPVSSWKFWVPEGTLASPLVLDKLHWATSLARPSHCLVLQHQPHHSSPFVVLFLDTQGLGQKGVSAILLTSLPGQPHPACQRPFVPPSIPLGSSWCQPGSGGGVGKRLAFKRH